MKVNFHTNTIELTAKEMKQASKPYTREYTELLRVMRDLPHFSITVKRSQITHNANRGLTYDCMERYIAENAPEKLDDFHVVRTMGGYPMTTKWFRMEFPEHDEVIRVKNNYSLAA